MTLEARSSLVSLFFSFASAACLAPGGAVVEVVDEPAVDSEQQPARVLEAELPLRPSRPLREDGVFYVLGAEAKHPRVRYLDGQLARNESCAIQLGNKLNRKIPPMYVNGQPIGFC